jgi:hypothetical protein
MENFKGVKMTKKQKQIIIALAAEARHAQKVPPIPQRFGLEFVGLIQSVVKQDKLGAVALAKTLKCTPYELLLEGFEFVFMEGRFHTAYGGKPWASVCRGLLSGFHPKELKTQVGKNFAEWIEQYKVEAA